MDYFDWGTRIAQRISQLPAGADLGEPGPTPRWPLDAPGRETGRGTG